MKNIFFAISFILTFLSGMSLESNLKYYNPSETILYDTIPYMVFDTVFENSYRELEDMFINENSYSLKRAEFLVENSYYGGVLKYNDYCHDIDSVVQVLNLFIDVNNFRQYRTAPNFALFEYFSKASIMNGNKKITYDFDDPLGEKDYSVNFAWRTLKTHKGQCVSMPLLYKILCDELGGHSALAFAPMHCYIKHIGEDGQWVNVELTHGGFVRDIWMIETMNVSTEAIRNGIFLCALNKAETIAFMIMQLARAYQFKYNSYDYFVERSVSLILNRLPNFLDALKMKFNLLQYRGLKFLDKFENLQSPHIALLHSEFKKTMERLDQLGYSQPTVEEYNAVLLEGMKITEQKKNE